jgi:membrane fusion protein (multidrug efflux system)
VTACASNPTPGSIPVFPEQPDRPRLAKVSRRLTPRRVGFVPSFPGPGNPDMNKRMFQMLILVLAFVAVIGYVKFQQISTAIAAGKSFQPPPEAVTTTVAAATEWASTISAVGSVAPLQGVTLSADLPGVVERIGFESGSRVREGDALVVLDTRQERAQLASAQAQRELAKITLDRQRKLLDQAVIAQSDYDLVAAQFKQADAAVLEIEASIGRKTILAPFSGIAGIRQVNLGQYVRSGDPVVPLQSLDRVYVDFAVPQQSLARLRVGDAVAAAADSSARERLSGRITAINPVVDDATRNVQVQATVENRGTALRPGMYVSVTVSVGGRKRVVALPASAINFAPYGNSVFIVEDLKGPDGRTYRGVRQQFVKLGASMGDLVAITDGVKPGQEVVTSGVFKLRTSAAVTVNNSVRPSASTNPHPQEN